MFVFPFDSFDFSFPWPVKCWLRTSLGLGLWNQFVIPAGRLFHWAAFDFDLLPASKAIVEG